MMKKLLSKTAFVHKNFRDLSFELKVIFVMNVLTAIFCFFPWISYTPLYGEVYTNSALSGPTKIIGFIILIVSLAIIALFLGKLFRVKFCKLPFSENNIFIFAGIEQLILFFCAWSVLFIVLPDDASETRFGLIFVPIFQIISLAEAIMLTRNIKKEEVKSFFSQAEKSIVKEGKNLFNSKKD